MARLIPCIILLVTTLWSLIPLNAVADEHDSQLMLDRFQNWQQKYNRMYRDEDEWEHRFRIYESNVKYIDHVNSRNYTYTLVDNQFADLTDEEFRDLYTGYNPGDLPKLDIDYAAFNVTALPDSVDWRGKGAVTSVKNQGQCGSCWAFSTVAAVEGINQIKTGKLVDLSEQQLVDCNINNGNRGCHGGLDNQAMQYIQENGLTTAANYPYRGTQVACDQTKTTNKAATITGYKGVPPNNEVSLQAIAAQQPVSVGIDAHGADVKFYKGGVFAGRSGSNLSHSICVVGYGVDGPNRFWLVKNSWGPEWGESGFMRLLRGIQDARGVCGIAMQAWYPLK